MLKEAGDVTESAPEPSKRSLPYAAKLLLFCGVAFLVIFFALRLWPSSKGNNSCGNENISYTSQDVRLYPASKKVYRIETASTPAQQERGLSGRPCFPADGAMIFMFPADDKFGIWMKNMSFAIDVAWLDKDKKVVSIVKDMQPATFPKIFYPSGDARYVIEFARGSIDELGAKVGYTFKW